MRKAIIVLVCLLAATAALAADKMNVIRGNVFYSDPTGDLKSTGFKLEPDSSVGVSGAYERKFTDLIGLNFDLAYVSWDVNIKGSGFNDKFAEGDAYPLTVSLLFHPLEKGAGADFYVGPAFSYVLYDDAKVESSFSSLFGTDKLSVKNDTAFGAQVGVDVQFDDTWSLNIDAKYIHTSAESKDLDGKLDINPINVGVGFSARF